MAVFHGGLKLPLFDGGDGFFVEAQSDAPRDADITRMSVSVDDQSENAGALILRLAGGFGVFRIGGRDGTRSRDATADAKYAAADSSSVSGANAGSASRANSPA